MNAMTPTTVDRQLERGLAADLAREFQAKVVRFTSPDPEAELEMIAKTHREAISKREQRIADTRKTMKATVASMEAAKKIERARHEAEMASLTEQIAEAKDRAERDTAADKRIVASNKAALAALAE